jgi:hypothetical protein
MSWNKWARNWFTSSSNSTVFSIVHFSFSFWYTVLRPLEKYGPKTQEWLFIYRVKIILITNQNFKVIYLQKLSTVLEDSSDSSKKCFQRDSAFNGPLKDVCNYLLGSVLFIDCKSTKLVKKNWINSRGQQKSWWVKQKVPERVNALTYFPTMSTNIGSSRPVYSKLWHYHYFYI